MVFTNRKSHTGFRLVPISVTSNDLELQRLFCVNSPISTRAVSAVAELLFYFCFSIMKNKADISAVTHGHNLPVRTNTGELFEWRYDDDDALRGWTAAEAHQHVARTSSTSSSRRRSPAGVLSAGRSRAHPRTGRRPTTGPTRWPGRRKRGAWQCRRTERESACRGFARWHRAAAAAAMPHADIVQASCRPCHVCFFVRITVWTMHVTRMSSLIEKRARNTKYTTAGTAGVWSNLSVCNWKLTKKFLKKTILHR